MITQNLSDSLFVFKVVAASCFTIINIILQIDITDINDILNIKNVTVSSILIMFLIYFIRLSEQLKKEHKNELQQLEQKYEKEKTELKAIIQEKDKIINMFYEKIINTQNDSQNIQTKSK